MLSDCPVSTITTQFTLAPASPALADGAERSRHGLDFLLGEAETRRQVDAASR